MPKRCQQRSAREVQPEAADGSLLKMYQDGGIELLFPVAVGQVPSDEPSVRRIVKMMHGGTLASWCRYTVAIASSKSQPIERRLCTIDNKGVNKRGPYVKGKGIAEWCKEQEFCLGFKATNENIMLLTYHLVRFGFLFDAEKTSTERKSIQYRVKRVPTTDFSVFKKEFYMWYYDGIHLNMEPEIVNKAMSGLILVGGCMGFMKGSKMSLIAGLGASALYLIHSKNMGLDVWTPSIKQAANKQSFRTSLVLFIVMLFRYLKTRKFMPSGLVALLTGYTAKLGYDNSR